MSDILWLDYESKSECDLLTKGAFNYAQHPSTEMLCAAYAFNDEDVQLWWNHEPAPQRLVDYFKSGGQIRCHNEEFDRLISWYVVCQDHNLAEPELTRWYCTAAQARANCAPGSLEDVGRFASSNMRKDHRGKQLIRLCCIPPFSTDPAVLAEIGEYAKQDVRAMRAVSLAMRPLSDEELADYHVNAKINMRGVLIDVPLCEAAVRYATDELVEIQEIVAEITDDEIQSVRSPKMKEWVLARIGDEAKKLMVVHKDGEKKYSIDKNVRANLLAMENPDEIPEDVKEVIQCADDLWASSVAKFTRAANLADEEDHRVRGAFVFAGGSATGRSSSYGIQLQNMPRKCAKDPTLVRQAMVRGHEIVPKYGARVTDVLKGMLRPMMVPAPGKVFVVADWASIEGRVNPWLCNTTAGEAKLELYRSGRDPYIVNAMAMFSAKYDDVTPAQRQVGKVQELALGFCGGAGAFASMARVYGVQMTDYEVQRAIKAWRRVNPWAMSHGRTLEDAYRRAMRHPNHEVAGGRVVYLFDGQHLWYALPSGRILCYPYAKIEDGDVTYAKASWKPAADAKEWPRAKLWPGLAVENITQATANDILRYSLRQLVDAVLHVHDEIILEVPEEDADAAAQQLCDVMCTPPEWATGLPLEIETSVMNRYGKG